MSTPNRPDPVQPADDAARAAVAAAGLPRGSTVEIQVIVELKA